VLDPLGANIYYSLLHITLSISPLKIFNHMTPTDLCKRNDINVSHVTQLEPCADATLSAAARRMFRVGGAPSGSRRRRLIKIGGVGSYLNCL